MHTRADSWDVVVRDDKEARKCAKAVVRCATTKVVSVLRWGFARRSTTGVLGGVCLEGASNENGTAQVD